MTYQALMDEYDFIYKSQISVHQPARLIRRRLWFRDDNGVKIEPFVPKCYPFVCCSGHTTQYTWEHTFVWRLEHVMISGYWLSWLLKWYSKLFSCHYFYSRTALWHGTAARRTVSVRPDNSMPFTPLRGTWHVLQDLLQGMQAAILSPVVSTTTRDEAAVAIFRITVPFMPNTTDINFHNCENDMVTCQKQNGGVHGCQPTFY